MWISKKKYEADLRRIKSEEFIKGMDQADEVDQWKRIEKLEKQVKKLKKIVKEGY